MKNRNAQKSAKGILVAAIVWSSCDVGAAFAQVGMGAVTPPLGVTSSLGIGAAAPVGATGLPLGATELATPGVSPMTSSSSVSGAMTMTTPSACSSTMGAMQTAASGTGKFDNRNRRFAPGRIVGDGSDIWNLGTDPAVDGAGIAGTASSTCATGSTASSGPTASASSPTIGSRTTVGRAGIPLGSTELPVDHDFFQSAARSIDRQCGGCHRTGRTATGQAPLPHRGFQGNAQAFQSSLSSTPMLIAAALIVIYIILSVLYESIVHPITILSTLPSASIGALLILMAFRFDLSVIALIGIILLIGIVKENAIMLIDFALESERHQHLSPEDAIYKACVLRFRPILMTTMAALLGAVPRMVGTGVGAELRQPLGYTIVGGPLVSQLLTLYTTPVVYLYLDRLRIWVSTLGTGRAAQDDTTALPAE
jgi:hypothetical protein